MAQSLQYAETLLDDGNYIYHTPKGAEYGILIQLIVAAGEDVHRVGNRFIVIQEGTEDRLAAEHYVPSQTIRILGKVQIVAGEMLTSKEGLTEHAQLNLEKLIIQILSSPERLTFIKHLSQFTEHFESYPIE